ncbi:phytoene/squalene synthase family protein [Rubrivirga sp. IMCC43871]|uniref:phytoene/squalene synthase family protein n=1 Tax=Rubrivirga sp. IMCC43871 TaxID=3391575 RepID=UPI00398FD05B
MTAPASAAFVAPPPPPAGVSRREQDRFFRRSFRHHSRTFSLATRLLPRPVQLPVAVLYHYCRTVDTLADERSAEIGADAALVEVDALEAGLDGALSGRPPGGEHALLWRRFADVHDRYSLDPHPLRQLLDGARWDLRGRTVETRADLLAYADLVAGSVGAAMLPFLVRDGADRARLDAPARAMGNAMQITNVLRDVGEDWRDLGRCYLPADDLAARGLDIGALVAAAPPIPDAYAELVESLMGDAERLYDQGGRGIGALRRRARWGIRSASRMYREFLNGVRANGYDNLSQRAAVPLPSKLRALTSDGYARRRDGLTA